MRPMWPTGGSLGLPADLLIGSDGRVVATKYGVHADDQWSVDELLQLALMSQGTKQPLPTGRLRSHVRAQ